MSTLYQDLNKPSVLTIKRRYKKHSEANNLHGDDAILIELESLMKRLV